VSENFISVEWWNGGLLIMHIGSS